MLKPSNIKIFHSLFGMSVDKTRFDHSGDTISKIHKVRIFLYVTFDQILIFQHIIKNNNSIGRLNSQKKLNFHFQA